MSEPIDEHMTADARLPAASGGSLKWVIAPVLVFAALVGLFAFALETGDPSKLPSALIGKPVPATSFPAVEGLRESEKPVPGFTSSDLAGGKVSVINFWASWCAQCADEQALLLQLREQAGVPLYGVNYKDEAAAARRFLGRYGNPFKAVGTDANGRNAIEWGVYGMPETFVVNGNGQIVFKHVGAVTPESLQTRLIPAIAQAQANAAASQPAPGP
jgi:cytochrome c biogenesis protein CcmG/thiol:disulfide interchange protein DsbE